MPKQSKAFAIGQRRGRRFGAWRCSTKERCGRASRPPSARSSRWQGLRLDLRNESCSDAGADDTVSAFTSSYDKIRLGRLQRSNEIHRITGTVAEANCIADARLQRSTEIH